jgi:hypothetical protein
MNEFEKTLLASNMVIIAFARDWYYDKAAQYAGGELGERYAERAKEYERKVELLKGTIIEHEGVE